MEQAIESWRSVDLHTLQSTIDGAAQTIATTQESSMVERKELATKTKEFRRLPDPEKLEQFKGLLKLYQGGIDTLTSRAKAAEVVVLDLWKQLADLPDPVPLLQAAVDAAVQGERSAELQAENASLRKQLDERSDYDELRRRLQAAEEAIETTAAERVGALQKQLAAELEEKEVNWSNKEQELQRQLKETRDALKEAAVDRKLSARLNAGEADEGSNTSGRLAELDMITKDLARANERLAQLEQRNAALRKENAALQAGDGTEARSAKQSLQTQLKTVEQDNESLVRRVERQQQEHRAALASAQLDLDRCRKESDAQTRDIKAMQIRLDAVKDYDEIRRELALLKKIEFSIDEDESRPSSSDDSSLERLLAGRNRKLEDELVQLRNALADLKGKYADLRTEHDLVQDDLSERSKLVAKLEEDLSRMNAGGSTYAPSIAPSRYTSRTRRTGRNMSPTTSIVGAPRELDPISALARSSPGVEAEGSVLPIITQQRDRFRQKNGELEEELRKQLGTASQLRAEIQTLKRDNAQLYERSRYLSQYGRKDKDVVLDMAGPSTPSKGKSDPFERYRAAYESGMNPFQRFRQRESARAMRGMNVLEKTLLNVVKHTLSNKVSRMVFGLYFLALHVAVIVMSVQLSGVHPPAARLRHTGPHDDFS